MLAIIIWGTVFFLSASTNRFWPWGVISIPVITLCLLLVQIGSWFMAPAINRIGEAKPDLSAEMVLMQLGAGLLPVAIIYGLGFGAGALVRFLRRKRAKIAGAGADRE